MPTTQVTQKFMYTIRFAFGMICPSLHMVFLKDTMYCLMEDFANSLVSEFLGYAESAPTEVCP